MSRNAGRNDGRILIAKNLCPVKVEMGSLTGLTLTKIEPPPQCFAPLKDLILSAPRHGALLLVAVGRYSN